LVIGLIWDFNFLIGDCAIPIRDLVLKCLTGGFCGKGLKVLEYRENFNSRRIRFEN